MSTCSRKSTLADLQLIEETIEDLYDEIDRLNELLEENLQDYNTLADEYASFRAEVAESHPDFFI